MPPPLRIGILVVSDRCAAGTARDLTGPALRSSAEARGWRVVRCEIVPDEAPRIAARLRALCRGADVVVAAGGTGLGPRDVTPEATRSVLDREVPGIAEAIRAAFRDPFPASILSRAVAGTRGKTLVIDLPGSPRGATESLAAVAGVLAHAREILAGGATHPPRGRRRKAARSG